MSEKEDDLDPLERMLKKTGCMELHYKVQECIAEKQDWRQCQGEVKTFRECMDKYTLSKKKKQQSNIDS